MLNGLIAFSGQSVSIKMQYVQCVLDFPQLVKLRTFLQRILDGESNISMEFNFNLSTGKHVGFTESVGGLCIRIRQTEKQIEPYFRATTVVELVTLDITQTQRLYELIT